MYACRVCRIKGRKIKIFKREVNLGEDIVVQLWILYPSYEFHFAKVMSIFDVSLFEKLTMR